MDPEGHGSVEYQLLLLNPYYMQKRDPHVHVAVATVLNRQPQIPVALASPGIPPRCTATKNHKPYYTPYRKLKTLLPLFQKTCYVNPCSKPCF